MLDAAGKEQTGLRHTPMANRARWQTVRASPSLACLCAKTDAGAQPGGWLCSSAIGRPAADTIFPCREGYGDDCRGRGDSTGGRDNLPLPAESPDPLTRQGRSLVACALACVGFTQKIRLRHAPGRGGPRNRLMDRLVQAAMRTFSSRFSASFSSISSTAANSRARRPSAAS